MCKVVSGMITLGEWLGMDWQENAIVQNCGRTLVKPKNQSGWGFAGSLMAEMKHNPHCRRLDC